MNNRIGFFKKNKKGIEDREAAHPIFQVSDHPPEMIMNANLIPPDVIKEEIIPYLSNKDLASFDVTCKFFHRLAQPKLKARKEGIIQIAANHFQTFLLHGDGSVNVFGFDEKNLNALLQGKKYSAIHARDDYVAFTDTNKEVTIYEMEIGLNPYASPKRERKNCFVQKDLKQLALNNNYYLMLLNNGELKGRGYEGLRYTLEGSEKLKGLKHIAVGSLHNLFLQDNGILFSSGDGEYGQLGWGPLNNPHLVPVTSCFSNVHKVYASNFSSFAILNDGSAWSWGCNSYGQLGVGDTNNRFTPTRIPGFLNVKQIAPSQYHTLFLTEKGEVYACGRNVRGRLGVVRNEENVICSLPIRIPSLKNIINIAASTNHNVVLDKDGNIYTFGYNLWNQLGPAEKLSRVYYEPQKINKKC